MSSHLACTWTNNFSTMVGISRQMGANTASAWMYALQVVSMSSSAVLVYVCWTLPHAGANAAAPLLYMAMSSFFFTLALLLYHAVPGDDMAPWWCYAYNYYFQLCANSVWIWTCVTALSSMISLLRKRTAYVALSRWKHLAWLVAAAAALPQGLRGNYVLNTTGCCDNDWTVAHDVNVAVLITCLLLTMLTYLVGVTNASYFSPHSVIDRFRRRTMCFITIFAACWVPYILWDVHENENNSSNKAPRTDTSLYRWAMALESLQGLLNTLVYAYFDRRMLKQVFRTCPCRCIKIGDPKVVGSRFLGSARTVGRASLHVAFLQGGEGFEGVEEPGAASPPIVLELSESELSVSESSSDNDYNSCGSP